MFDNVDEYAFLLLCWVDLHLYISVLHYFLPYFHPFPECPDSYCNQSSEVPTLPPALLAFPCLFFMRCHHSIEQLWQKKSIRSLRASTAPIQSALPSGGCDPSEWVHIKEQYIYIYIYICIYISRKPPLPLPAAGQLTKLRVFLFFGRISFSISVSLYISKYFPIYSLEKSRHR